jgi:hexokinase
LPQIINTEWGAFSDGIPLTVFDRDMDAASINPGEQVTLVFCVMVNYVYYAVITG